MSHNLSLDSSEFGSPPGSSELASFATNTFSAPHSAGGKCRPAAFGGERRPLLPDRGPVHRARWGGLSRRSLGPCLRRKTGGDIGPADSAPGAGRAVEEALRGMNDQVGQLSCELLQEAIEARKPRIGPMRPQQVHLTAGACRSIIMAIGNLLVIGAGVVRLRQPPGIATAPGGFLFV
jgi:hypothetical protein